MYRSLLAITLVALTGLNNQAQVVRRAGPPPPTLTLATPIVSVPTGRFGARPTVEVMVNGAGPFTFILDTGASGTVITKAFLDAAKLPVIGEARVGSPNGEAVSAPLAQIDRLQIGGITLDALVVPAVDLSHLWREGPVGILSPATLPAALVSLLGTPTRLQVEKGGLPEANGVTIFDWPQTDRLPGVPVSVGSHTIVAHVDSGAPGGLKLPVALAKTLPLRTPLTPISSARMMDREVAQWEAELETAPTLAGRTLPHRVVFQQTTTAANLGAEGLADFALTIDTGNRRIRLTAQPSSAVTGPDFSMSGQYAMVRDWVLKAAAAMPEADYGFKPVPTVRSFGAILGHIANATGSICTAAGGSKSPLATNAEQLLTKADVQKALNSSFVACDAVWARVTSAWATETVTFSGRSQTRLAVLTFNTAHAMEHYGNLVTYLRIKGLVPPSSGG